MKNWLATLIAIASLTSIPSHAASDASSSLDPTPSALGSVERAPNARQPDDPCLASEIAATPSRPIWTAGAQTTQCNVLEFDFGWLHMPMEGGVKQVFLPTSVRYGLTPRMDLRWGAPAPIVQFDERNDLTHGVSDESFSVTYRFWDQHPHTPALAFGYGIKEPRANPAKGFGTGYVDHQLVFVASRDLGRTHVDLNTMGTIAGSANHHDGALLFGLVLALPISQRLSWFLESEGGSEPGTADRYGAALNGISWSLRPWLVADAAYTHAYTAGAPHSQMTLGLTYARRSGFMPLPRSSRMARWLGR